MKWIRRYPVPVALYGIVALIAIVMFLTDFSGSDPVSVPVADQAVPTPPPTSAQPTSPPLQRPEVPPVNCSPLITLEDVDDALDVDWNGHAVTAEQTSGR